MFVDRGDGRGESAPTVIKNGLSIFRNSVATDLAEGLGLAVGVGVPIPLPGPISVPFPVPVAELGPTPGVSMAESEGVGVGFALMDCAPPLLPAPELGVPVNQRLKAVFVNSRDWGMGGATSESGAWIGTRPSARGDTRTVMT